MITSYRPQTGRWIAASFLMIFAFLWGGFGLFDYIKEPKWTSPDGTAAEHVRRGRELLDGSSCGFFEENCYGPSPRAVSVAALEFEAALLIDPLSEEAALGKAECLEHLGDDSKEASPALYYRQALPTLERTLRSTRDIERRRSAQEKLAGLYSKLGEHRKALEGYQRLLPLTPAPYARLEIYRRIAETLEALGRNREALIHFEQLQLWTEDWNTYAEDVERVQTKIMAGPPRSTSSKSVP